MPLLDDWNTDESTPAYVLSSSDGEDSDGDVFLTPVNDVDLPSVSVSNNDAITLAAHRLATLGRERKKHRQVRRTFANGFVLDILVFHSEYSYIILKNIGGALLHLLYFMMRI